MCFLALFVRAKAMFYTYPSQQILKASWIVVIFDSPFPSETKTPSPVAWPTPDKIFGHCFAASLII